MEGSGEKRRHGGRFSPERPAGACDRAAREGAARRRGAAAAARARTECARGAKPSGCGRLHRVHAGRLRGRARALDARRPYMAAVLACGGDCGALASIVKGRASAGCGEQPIDPGRVCRAAPGRAGPRGHRRAYELDAARARHRDRRRDPLHERRSHAARSRRRPPAPPRRARLRSGRGPRRARRPSDRRRSAAHERAPGQRHAALDPQRSRPGCTLTRNALEERVPRDLSITPACHDPSVNVHIPLEPTGYEADFLWREQRLIAETDGTVVARHAAARLSTDRRARPAPHARWLPRRPVPMAAGLPRA